MHHAFFHLACGDVLPRVSEESPLNQKRSQLEPLVAYTYPAESSELRFEVRLTFPIHAIIGEDQKAR